MTLSSIPIEPAPSNTARVFGGIAALALTLTALPARAEPSRSDDLFQQGKALMDQGMAAAACEKFAESLAILRRGGTLLNLAACREKEGKNATALRLFAEAQEVARRDGRADRDAASVEGISRVRSKVSWLTVRLAAGAATPDLAITCDGEALPRDTWGTPFAIDPGQHTVVASAPGRARLSSTVVVGPIRDQQAIEILPLGPAVTGIGPRNEPSPGAANPTTNPSLTWPGVVGWTAIGVGAAAAVVGGVFGGKAIVDSHESQRLCPQHQCPSNTDGYQRNLDARREARVADVTIPIGVALAGAGVFVLVRSWGATGAEGRGTAGIASFSPMVGAGIGGVLLRGAW